MFGAEPRQTSLLRRIVIGLSCQILLLVCQPTGLKATAAQRIAGADTLTPVVAEDPDSPRSQRAEPTTGPGSKRPRTVELAISFNVEGLEELIGPFGKDVRSISVSGVVGEIPGGLRVEDFSVRIGSYQTGGTVEVLLSGDRPRVRATLSSDQLTVAIPPRPALTGGEDEGQSIDRKIPDIELPFDALRDMDADVELELSVGTLNFGGRIIEDAKISLSVINATHADARVAGTLFGGELTAVAEVGLGEGMESVNLVVNGRGLQPELMPILQQNGRPSVTGAVTELNVQASAKGSNLRQLASGLNGGVLVESGAGRIRNNVTNLMGASLFYMLSQAINPFARSDKVTELECAVAHFELKDGAATANQGIAMQTKKVDVIASGLIDLDTEAIDFSAKPVAKQGLGISLSSVASIVRVRGTVSEPQLAIGAKAAALRIGAGIGTGGISVLAESLYSNLAADPTPCATARQPADARVRRGALESAADSGAGAVEKVTTGAGEVLKGAATGTRKAAKGVAEGAGAVIKGAGRAATGIFRGLVGSEQKKESQDPETSNVPP